MNPYIPPRDASLRDWARNFALLIAATPAAFGLSVPDATQITTVQVAFDDALSLSVDPSTRTGPNIAAKDATKSAFLAVARPYAIQIRNNFGITNDAKLALGLTIPDPGKSPIPAPSTNPLLAIIGATPGAHTLRFADANTPDKRKKPFGAIGLEVWRVVADAPVMTPAGALFMAMVTRQPFGSTFAAEDNGKTCTYFARWVTRTGLVGAWSAPVSMTICA